MYKLIFVNNDKTEVILDENQNFSSSWADFFMYNNYDNVNLLLSVEKEEALLNMMNKSVNANPLESKLYNLPDGNITISLEDMFIEKNISIEEFDSFIKDLLTTNNSANESDVEEAQFENMSKEEYFKKKKKQNMQSYDSASVTKAIIIANVVVFIIFKSGLLPASLILHGHVPNTVITFTNILSIFVSGFLQWTVLHILFNMMFLYYVGSDIEKLIGKAKFLIVYLICLFGSGMAVLLFTNPLTITAGASGALFGLLGFLIMYLIVKGVSFSSLANNSGLLSTLVINVIYTFAGSNISVVGHLSGLAVGAVLGLIIALIEKK